MTQYVDFNGEIVGFPDDMDDSDIRRVLRDEYARLEVKRPKLAPEQEAPRPQATPEQRAALNITDQGPTSAQRGGGYLGLAAPATPEKLGREARRLIDREIRTPEDYGMTQGEWKELVKDPVTEARKAAKESGEEPPKEQPPRDDSQRGFGAWMGAIWGKQVPAGLEVGARTSERVKAQETTIGQEYLNNIREQFPNLGPGAKKILTDAADRHGMSLDEYASFTASQVDNIIGLEGDALDRYSDILQDIETKKPLWAMGSRGRYPIQYYAGLVLENSPQFAYIAAGMATRNPALTMSLLGTDVYARTYADARMEGRSDSQASMDALSSTVIEIASEGVAVNKLMNLWRAGNKSGARKLLVGVGTEGGQEMIAEAGQIAYDWGIIKEDMSWGDVWFRMQDAGIVGAVIGGAVATPAAAFGDDVMAEAKGDLSKAADNLKSVVRRMVNPKSKITRSEVQDAQAQYKEARKALDKIVTEREEEKKEKAKAKEEGREAKRVKKLTAAQLATEDRLKEARDEAAKTDQSVTELTDEDVRIGQLLEKAAAAEIRDPEQAQELMELGLAKVTSGGALVLLPPGKRRLKAIKAAKTEQIGAEEKAPEPYKVSTLAERVTQEVTSPETREEIATNILRAEQEDQAWAERESQREREIVEARDQDFQDAIDQMTSEGVPYGNSMSLYADKEMEKGGPGVMRQAFQSAMQALEKREAKAQERLQGLWQQPAQGALFDVTEVFIRGTKLWSAAVEVAALKVAKHGLNYAAYASEMVGQFGESIRPVLRKLYQEGQKRVGSAIKQARARFKGGQRKGELIAGPKRYAKPGQIRNLRRTLQSLHEEGADARYWYEQSINYVLDIAGTKSAARKLAGLLAIYSSGTAVDANATNALKMWSMYQSGDLKAPEKGETKAGRFSEQDRTAIKWLTTNMTDETFITELGNKREPFYINMASELYPEKYGEDPRSTFDMWMMRAFGFHAEAPTDAQSVFGQLELGDLAKSVGWKPKQLQASIWVAIKARWEHVSATAKERAVKEQKAKWVFANIDPDRPARGKKKTFEVLNMPDVIDIFREEALSVAQVEIKERLEKSGRTFEHALKRHLGYVSWESSIDETLSLETKLALQAEIQKVLTNPETGRNVIVERLGLLGSNAPIAPGAWDGDVGVATQQEVLVPPKHKKGAAEAAVEPNTEDRLNAFSAIMGYLLRQNAVGWHRPFLASGKKGQNVGITTLKDSNGVRLELPQLDQERTMALYEQIIMSAKEFGVPRAKAINWAPIVFPEGAHILNDSATTDVDNKTFHKIILDAVKVLQAPTDVVAFSFQGNLVTNDWSTYRNGEEYTEAVNNLGDPVASDVFEWAKSVLAPEIQQARKRIAEGKGREKRVALPMAHLAVMNGATLPEDVGVTLVSDGLGPVPEGNIRFRHFSTVETDMLDLAYFGTGLKGEERNRGSAPVISAYPDTGFQKEEGLGDVEYAIDVPESKIYDANADPRNLKEEAQYAIASELRDGKLVPVETRLDMNEYERLIKEAGFVGYYTPEASGNLKGQARFFQNLTVNQEAKATEAPRLKVAKHPLKTVRTEDFEFDGTYNIDLPDGSTTQVFRDPDDRMWYQPDATVRFTGGLRYVGDTREEALQSIWDAYLKSTGGVKEPKPISEGSDILKIGSKADEVPENIVLEEPGLRVDTDDATTEKLMSYITEYYEELTQPNPLGDNRYMVVTVGGEQVIVQLEVEPWGSGIMINSISVARPQDRGKGAGGEVMRQLVELADKHGVSLTLKAHAFGDGPGRLSTKQLVKWYQDIGFEIEAGTHMVRAPHASMAVETIKLMHRGRDFEPAVSPERAQSIAEAFINAFDLQDFNINVYEDIDSLPAWQSIDIATHFGIEGLQSFAGSFANHPEHGPMVTIISNVALSEEHLVNTLYHETMGHWGLQAFLGDKYAITMDRVARSFPKEMRAAARRNTIELNQGAASGFMRRRAAEEVIAYSAGDMLAKTPVRKQQQKILDTIIGEVRRVIQDLANLLGIKMAMNEADILHLIWRAHSFVKNNTYATMTKRANISDDIEMSAYYQDRMDAEANTSGQEPSDNPLIQGSYLPKPGRVAKRAKKSQERKRRNKLKDLQKRREVRSEGPHFSIQKERETNDDLDRFMRKIGRTRKTPLKAIGDWWSDIRINWSNRFEMGFFDNLSAIKHIEKELGIEGVESAYITARLSRGADAVIRASLEFGRPFWDEGTANVDTSHKGLVEILRKVGESPDMFRAFETWLVARRAYRLTKEDRERLFTPAEIKAALQMPKKLGLTELFEETAAELSAYKKSVLDFAEEAGLINKETRPLWEHHDHIPFYRLLEQNDVGGSFSSQQTMSVGAALGKVRKQIVRLRGGTQNIKDPLEAVVQNMANLIESSMKNKAAVEVVRNLEDTGLITKGPQAEISTALVPLDQVKNMLNDAGVALDAVGDEMLSQIAKLMTVQAPTDPRVIHMQVNGKKQYYTVHDQGLLNAVSNINASPFGRWMEILRIPKRILTRAITLAPDFILKNWWRDMWHAFTLGRHKAMPVIPVVDSFKGWAKAIAQDEDLVSMMGGGAVFDAGYVNASDPGITHRNVRRDIIQSGGFGRVLNTTHKLARFYMRLANGAENAHRITVYNNALDVTGSRKLALYESRDLMDFSVRGNWKLVKFMTEAVPFWGARVQGLQRTYRGFRENPMAISMRGGLLVVASVALYMLNRDDDRFKALNDYDRYMYYHFFDVFEEGDHWRLPKPFEVGAMFSTTPEILTELMLSNEPDKGTEAMKAFIWTATEMLSLGPQVQAIQPMIELGFNKNFFTEAPILSDWDKKLLPEEQASYRTSRTITSLAKAMPDIAPEWSRSPKQLEHLMRGYFGTLGDYAMMASDLLWWKAHAEEVGYPPTMRFDEMPFVKAFRRESQGKYDKYLNAMYSIMEDADRVYNSIEAKRKENTELGDIRAEELEAKHEELLWSREIMQGAVDDIRKLNREIREIYADPDMMPEEKRKEIDLLFKDRSEIAKDAYPDRPGGTLNPMRDPPVLDQIIGMNKRDAVDMLIKEELPNTAVLINDMRITRDKLERVS